MFGQAGDLADLTCDTEADNVWHPDPGDIKWRQAPGHSPGGLILQIGRNIIAGDVVAAMRYPWCDTRSRQMSFPVNTCIIGWELCQGAPHVALLSGVQNSSIEGRPSERICVASSIMQCMQFIC